MAEGPKAKGNRKTKLYSNVDISQDQGSTCQIAGRSIMNYSSSSRKGVSNCHDHHTFPKIKKTFCKRFSFQDHHTLPKWKISKCAKTENLLHQCWEPSLVSPTSRKEDCSIKTRRVFNIKILPYLSWTWHRQDRENRPVSPLPQRPLTPIPKRE